MLDCAFPRYTPSVSRAIIASCAASKRRDVFMKILALNCGSSSIKFQLFETSRELMARNEDRVLTRGTGGTHWNAECGPHL